MTVSAKQCICVCILQMHCFVLLTTLLMCLVSAGDPGVRQGLCPNRKESRPLTSRSASLFLMNYFPTYPVEDEACKEHSTALSEMLGTCYKAAGNVMPNFLAVNFYMVSNLGFTVRVTALRYRVKHPNLLEYNAEK